MSVKHALQCHDIVVEIFQHLYTPSDFRIHGLTSWDYDINGSALLHLNQSTLAYAARTCRAFSGPALDVLWRDLPDIISLFRILPHYEGTEDDEYRTVRRAHS